MDPSVKITHHVFSVEGPTKEAEKLYQQFLERLSLEPTAVTTTPPPKSSPAPINDLYVEIPQLAKFVRRHYVSKYVDKTLVLAYYLTTQMDREEFFTSDIQRLYNTYARRVPRFMHGVIMRNLDRGMFVKTGHIRGQEHGLAITEKGKRYVERNLRRSRYWSK